jgi:hypothetical protein
VVTSDSRDIIAPSKSTASVSVISTRVSSLPSGSLMSTLAEIRAGSPSRSSIPSVKVLAKPVCPGASPSSRSTLGASLLANTVMVV